MSESGLDAHTPETPSPGATGTSFPVRQAWLDSRREPIIEPELPIVDTHHHLVDRPDTGRYLLPELMADIGSGHNIVATVYAEWLSMYRADGPMEMRPVGEIEFANGVAAMSASGVYGTARVCAGIVGHADLPLGAAVEPVLRAQIAAGNGRFRGIRFITATHPPDHRLWGQYIERPRHFLLDPKVREGVACLEKLGLTLDAWLYHTQHDDLVALTRAFPKLAIVLDHGGGAIGMGPYLGKRDEVFAIWRDGMRKLAQCPNVHIKIGGLCIRVWGFAEGLVAGKQPPGSEHLATLWRPYVETCIEAFGPDRAMFESNFPVDKGCCSYAVLWNAFKRITAGCSPTDKRALYAGTANRFYRLGLPAL